MKKIPKIWNFGVIFYSLFALIVICASFMVIYKENWGIGSNIILVSSIITLVTAVMTPLFSMKTFNLSSYKIKMYSLLIGLIAGVITIVLLVNNHPFILELIEYSKNGLLWGINTALLFISLVILEIENNENKIKEVSNEIIELKKQGEAKDRKIIEMQEVILKGRTHKKGDNNE